MMMINFNIQQEKKGRLVELLYWSQYTFKIAICNQDDNVIQGE